MNEHVIQTHGLTRYYGSTCAVDQLTLNVPRGSVFALLGRNGSGKSTLIRMLMGLLEPTRGSATVLGEDCRKLSPATRGRIGYVAEGHPLIDWMRVRDLESFQRGFYPDWNGRLFKTVIEHFGLSPDARAKQLSRGQRAGVSLAMALATNPELLVMDNPALGLDPVARRSLLEAMILLTRDSGHTILFSSHVLNDVERVASHIAIIDRSILRVSCPVETFRDNVKRFSIRLPASRATVPEIPGLLQLRRGEHGLDVVVANFSAKTEEALNALGGSLQELPLTLEDVVVGYLTDRRQSDTLLQATQEMEAAR